MKFRKIIAIMIMLIASATIFIGCGLFAKNGDKQLGLVVAEVKDSYTYTNSEGIATTIEFCEQITRRDLIVYYYNNNGSNYVSDKDSLKATLVAFLDQLISRKVFFIEGKKYFAENPYENSWGANYSASDFSGTYSTKYQDYKDAKYLTNTELEWVELEVKYADEKNINNYKDSILAEWYPQPESDKTTEEKTYNAAPKAKPEEAPKAPKAPKPWELPEAYFMNSSDLQDALAAQVEAEAILRYRQQIDAEGYTDKEYHDKQITSTIEQKIIEKYRDVIYTQIKAELAGTDSKYKEVEDLFNALRQVQIEASGVDYDTFISKATSPSDGDFLLYYPSFGTSFQYITVKHILVKFDEDTQARLDYLKTLMSPNYNNNDPNGAIYDKYFEYRDALVKYLVAKDLRDPYDWDITEEELYETFNENEDGDNLKSFDIAVFLQYIRNELDEVSPSDPTDPEYDYNARVEKFAELMFAYTEDTAALNTAYDYVVGPYPTAGGSETFMQEFADAARKFTDTTLYATADDAIGAIEYCVTDYGVHIIMCTGIINSGTEITFNYEDITSPNYESISYKYFNYIYTNKKDAFINRYQENMVDAYIEGNKITKYLENLQDLWK